MRPAQMLLHEPLCPDEQLESMPVSLLVVDELIFGDASKTRHAKLALWIMRHEAVSLPEEHHGGIEQPTMLDQIEAKQ